MIRITRPLDPLVIESQPNRKITALLRRAAYGGKAMGGTTENWRRAREAFEEHGGFASC